MKRHSPSSQSSQLSEVKSRVSIDIVCLSILFVLLCAALYLYVPRFYTVDYVIGDGKVQGGLMPLSLDSTSETMTVNMTMNLSLISPRLFTIRADDCLTSLIVNEAILHTSLIEPCEIDQPKDFVLGGLLHSGMNTIIATVQDTGGRQGISIDVSRSDPLFLMLRIAIAATLLSIFSLALRRTQFGTAHVTMVAILLLAIGVRLLYFDVTSPWMRGNDIGGHIQYIKHVAQFWTIPPIHGGWQFYQPPLYYFISAITFTGLGVIGVDEFLIIRSLQVQSLALSFVALILFALFATRLFTDRERYQQYLWLFLVAVFPSLIFIGTQVNNDILILTLSFAALLSLLHFWQTLRLRFWYTAMILIGLGILTKSNAILMIPVAVCTILLATSSPIKKRLLHTFLGCLVLLNVTAWLHVHRLHEDNDFKIVGNVDSLSSALAIPNDRLSDYVTFSIPGMLRDPFTSPWAGEERARLFEIYFKTALFGEERIPDKVLYARILLAVHLFALIAALIGFLTIRTKEWKRSAPLLLTFIFLIGGQVAFRYLYPFASSQHFRYTAVVLVPVLYYAVRGAMALPAFYRSIALTFLFASGIASVVWVVVLALA